MGGLSIDMPRRRQSAAAATRANDPPAIAWFDDALPRIFGYFLPRVGGDIGVAEDLTQETMLAAVRAQGDGAAVGAAIPWLFGIARHKLIDHYRSVRHHDDRDLDDLPDDGRRLPVLDLHAIHTRDAIVRTLAGLPPRQRLAIVLRYLDDQPVAEVALALDLSLTATESLLARARRAFRHHYLAFAGETP